MQTLEQKLLQSILTLTQKGAKDHQGNPKGKYGILLNTEYKLVIDNYVFMVYRKSIKHNVTIKIMKPFQLVISPDFPITQNIVYWEINKNNQLVKSKSLPREANQYEIDFFSNTNNQDIIN